MNVNELTKNQLTELKQHYYTERHDNVSYGELADIDELVSDEEVKQEYAGILFTEDDFFSTEEKPDYNTLMDKEVNITLSINELLTIYTQLSGIWARESLKYYNAKRKKEYKAYFINQLKTINDKINKKIEEEKEGR